jgi:hypothetical protein
MLTKIAHFARRTSAIGFAAAVMLVGAMPVQALAATKYKIDVEVTGEANAATKTEAVKASPTITQNAGTTSTFKISALDKGDRLRITVTAAEPDGETVMVDLKIEMRQTDGSFTTSTSKVKATLGTATSMALETDTGAELDLSLKVTKAP